MLLVPIVPPVIEAWFVKLGAVIVPPLIALPGWSAKLVAAFTVTPAASVPLDWKVLALTVTLPESSLPGLSVTGAVELPMVAGRRRSRCRH